MATEPVQSFDGGAGQPGYRFGMRTHVGLRRERNEDFLVVRGTSFGLLAVVCDGMGGHAGGEQASRLAVAAVAESVESAGAVEAGAILSRAVLDANAAVVREALLNPEHAGMGTTLVAALASQERVAVVNVGDSRAYVLRAGAALERITLDHSLVGEMVARGEITEEEAAYHPRRNIITRALGTPGVEGELFATVLGPDDVLLLATDGLHGMIGDAEIRDVLAANGDPERVCDLLVERALAAGGHDNVTVVVIRRATGNEPADTPTDPGSTPGRRKPRGLGLIIGVGFGAVLGLAFLIILFRELMIGVEERGRIARDTAGIYVPDSLNSWDSSALRDSLNRDSSSALPDSNGSYDAFGYTPSHDSVRTGDMIEW